MRSLALLLTGFALGAVAASLYCTREAGLAMARSSPPLPGQAEADLAAVIATVDGVPITVGEVQARINEQPSVVRARYAALERKRELLDNLVRTELQYAEAARRGFDTDAAVLEAARQLAIQKLVSATAATAPERASDDDLRAYYQAHAAEFSSPEEVRISAIRVRDLATAERVAAAAKGTDAKGFRELVVLHTVDESTRERGGDLGYFTLTANTLPAEVLQAAFAVEKTSDVAGPIATASGFYVIAQTGRRPAVNQSFEAVKQQLGARLYEERRAQAVTDLIANLGAKAKVEIDEAALAKVRVAP